MPQISFCGCSQTEINFSQEFPCNCYNLLRGYFFYMSNLIKLPIQNYFLIEVPMDAYDIEMSVSNIAINYSIGDNRIVIHKANCKNHK